MANNIKKLQDMGYVVELSSERYTDPATEDDVSAVWHVDGFGLSMYVREDDDETWNRLTNVKAHESRKAQHDNPELSPVELLEKDLAAQVDLGDISQTDADDILESRA